MHLEECNPVDSIKLQCNLSQVNMQEKAEILIDSNNFPEWNSKFPVKESWFAQLTFPGFSEHLFLLQAATKKSTKQSWLKFSQKYVQCWGTGIFQSNFWPVNEEAVKTQQFSNSKRSKSQLLPTMASTFCIWWKGPESQNKSCCCFLTLSPCRACSLRKDWKQTSSLIDSVENSNSKNSAILFSGITTIKGVWFTNQLYHFSPEIPTFPVKEKALRWCKENPQWAVFEHLYFLSYSKWL